MQAHVVDMRGRALKSSTIARAEFHLRAFFQLDGEENGEPVPYAHSGGLLDALRPRRCDELYGALIKDQAVDTHRNALSAAKKLGEWCVAQGWIRSNPVDGVKPVGQRNRGKRQLRLDEARKLVELCEHKAKQGDEGAIAVMTAFLLGVRASEVTNREVRDLDDDGRLLWIEFGKTRRSRRTLEVPAVLQPYLRALAADRAPYEQLISRTAMRSGRRCDRNWLLYETKKLCKEAKVPAVCTHSLRGLHATLATDAGATSHVVAAALGHTSTKVTQAHYIDGAAMQRAMSRRVVDKLGTGPETSAVGNG